MGSAQDESGGGGGGGRGDRVVEVSADEYVLNTLAAERGGGVLRMC